MIEIVVNGEPRQVPDQLCLPELLEQLGYQPRLVVVECNGAILPRGSWAEQRVRAADVLEVVTIVGGG